MQISPGSSNLHSLTTSSLRFISKIFTSVNGSGKPTEPILCSPSGGLHETKHVASVIPYPSIMDTPVSF